MRHEFLTDLRESRGWSQQRLADALADASGRSTITRHEVSRWERGDRSPSRFWLPWLARVLDVPVAMLERSRDPAAELAARTASGDTGAATLALLEAEVDDAAVAYASQSGDLPALLRARVASVLRLLDARSTLAGHQRLLIAGAWFSLLTATVLIDDERQDRARAYLRTARLLARDAGHAEIAAWCVETKAWAVLMAGDYRRAAVLSQGAQRLAPEGSSVLIQATAQEGRAWSRLGDRRGTFGALHRTTKLTEPLRPPDRPEHHYRYDPGKAHSYEATTLSWLGDPAAERYARNVVSELEPRPRRAALARLDLARALVAGGRPDEAAHEALGAVRSGRLVPANYWRAEEIVTATERAEVGEARPLREVYDTLVTP